MLRVSPSRTVYLAGRLAAALCALAWRCAATGWIAASSWALETCHDCPADSEWRESVLARAGLGIIWADKVIAAATPSRAGAAAYDSRWEMRKFVGFLRWRPKGLLLAMFALTGKADGYVVLRSSPVAFGAPDITEA